MSKLRLSRMVKATPRVNQKTYDETNNFIELSSPRASFWCINAPHTLQSVTDLEHPIVEEEKLLCLTKPDFQ